MKIDVLPLLLPQMRAALEQSQDRRQEGRAEHFDENAHGKFEAAAEPAEALGIAQMDDQAEEFGQDQQQQDEAEG